jgi:clathrin heavy chain
MNQLPIEFKEVIALPNIGIDASLCKFNFLSFESDKYISAKDVGQDGSTNIIICEIEKNFNVYKKKILKVEAAMMHTTQNIIALRAKNAQNSSIIQVFNLDTQEKLKDITINYDIDYWKWLSDKVIGIVTKTSVLALSIDAVDSPAKKIFDRSGALANQGLFVMNLSVDATFQWFALSAIGSSKDGNKVIVNGYIQLYFVTQNQSQQIEGFCANFGSVKCIDDNPVNLLTFIEKKSNENKYSLMLMDITNKRIKLSSEVLVQDEDFPSLLSIVKNYGLVFIITTKGNFYIYEITKAACLLRFKLTDEACMFAAENTRTGGVYYISKNGKLLSVNVDPNNFLPFVMQYTKNVDNLMELCVHMASRYSLPGAEKIFQTLFKTHMQNGNYIEAARVCRDTPGDALRNIDTINMFRAEQGSPNPILVYFQTVMEKGKLNKVESIEIVKTLIPMIMQTNNIDPLEKLLNEGKLTASEELSEMVNKVNPQMGLKILLASGSPSAHGKIVEGLVSTGQFDKIFTYCQQNQYKPDWVTLLRNVIVVNPEAAAGLSKVICNRQTSTYLIDVNTIIEIFTSRKRIQELTSFLVEYLKDNRPEDSFLQTKIIELNLYESPKAAQVILESNLLSHFDKQRIAQLCERMGLLQAALENYTDINDIKRVILNTHHINPNYLVEFLGRMIPENILISLHELLRANPMQNLNIVIEAAVKYAQRIPLNELVKLFETYGSYNGLYLFINRIVNIINDPDIMFKYIQAGVITNNFMEVQRVIKEYDNYDPAKILDFFLNDKKLVDPKPLIILCDKHDYIEQLTVYLYKNKLSRFLENYVIQLRPQSTPRVLGALIDEDCDEAYLKQLLNTVRGNCPIEPLVDEFVKRNKVRVLQKFLEDREGEGNPTPALHNALAMIYIEANPKHAEDFLIQNKHYDSTVVGNYCEERDPRFAVIAYRRANGKCDDELIHITNKHAMWRDQAQYLVESVKPDLWKKVLDADNENKKFVIDQVISVILPVNRNPEEVRVTVRAFIDAGLQSELMELLEKLVLHNPEFSRNKSLQNLLILTAITAAPNKVKGFLNKLDSYEGPELAVKCIEHNLFEEAYFIYDKIKDYTSAIDVIIKYMDDLKRATIFAEKINTPEVWSRIGRAKLNQGAIDEAIEAFIKSNDAEMYLDVINVAERQGKFEDLIRYLTMARTIKKDKIIDAELVYSYSKSGKLTDLESFLSSNTVSELSKIADRLYDEKIFEPAKILYENLGNNARLASCLVHLKQYPAALTAAKKANTPKCWKEVCFACVKAGEFRLATAAANNIITNSDLVDEIIKEYEKWGAYTELLFLFEANIGQERNHIITELAILYSKYNEEKIMDHCRNYYDKMNVPKVIRICELHYQWPEVVFLHTHYNGYDNALMVMMEHSPSAWKHDLFCQTLQKVTNSNLYSEALRFYIDEQPQLLNDMLKVISNKLDLSTTVYELRKYDALALALPFLKSVQSSNNFDVNEALNEIFVEDEDPESLKNSILEYSSFDQLNLAKKIENHSLLEFRRISALVYRKNKKFQQSIDISKKLEYYKDAIETGLESGNDKLCEDLLRFFASIGDKECFCACLYTCYELVKPDVAMELAWRYDFVEFLMPYMIQTVRDLTIRMDHMQRKAEDSEKQKKKEIEEQVSQPLDVIYMGMNNNGLVPFMPGMGGMGGPGYPPMDMGMGGMNNINNMGGPGFGNLGGWN